MKIAKYILLLVVLIFTATAVFVSTKDGKFYVVKSKIITIPKSTLYSYILDLKNNKDYNAWEKDLKNIKNIEASQNDSIIQILSFKEKNTQVKWEFKDTLKSTKVSLSTKGELEFKDKLLAILGKGVQNNFDEKFENQLSNINTFLTTEINSFNIKMNGFVNRDTVFYIQKVVACKEDELPKKINAFLPKLVTLLKSTGTKSSGSPFIIYHSRDTIGHKINFSIAIPTQYKVLTSTESDIVTGQTNPFQAVKATLTGNYIHKPKALKQIYAFMEKNKLEQSPKHKEIDIITSNIVTNKSAAKWQTEIYIPVRPKKVIFKPRVVKDSILVVPTI